MTDLEKFKQLYASVGITPDAEIDLTTGKTRRLILEAGSDDKVVGYIGFVTCLAFDDDGKFIHQEIAEG